MSSRRRSVDAVQIGPLPHQAFGIHRHHGRVGIAVPHRHARPRPAMARSRAHQVAPFVRAARAALKHALEGLLDIARRAVWQARDDRAGREHLRIGRQHGRRHRAAGREPGDEDAPAVDVVGADGLLDHLADRQHLAAIARGVVRARTS